MSLLFENIHQIFIIADLLGSKSHHIRDESELFVVGYPEITIYHMMQDKVDIRFWGISE